MSDKELTRLLREVHDELEDTGEVSAEQRELLAELMAEIREHVDERPEDEHGFGERLGEAVEQFAQTHPTLAFTLRRIMDSLAKMGI